MLRAFVVAAFAASAYARPLGVRGGADVDEIKSIPGYSGSFLSPMYGGYISVDEGR